MEERIECYKCGHFENVDGVYMCMNRDSDYWKKKRNPGDGCLDYEGAKDGKNVERV